MNRAGVGCVGLTARGRRCQNTTTNQTGICGRCSETASVTALLVQSAAALTPTAWTDPLADPTPLRTASWSAGQILEGAVTPAAEPATLTAIATHD